MVPQEWPRDAPPSLIVAILSIPHIVGFADFTPFPLMCSPLPRQVVVLDELFGGLATLRLGFAALRFSDRIPWRSKTSLDHARREQVHENQVSVGGEGGSGPLRDPSLPVCFWREVRGWSGGRGGGGLG